MLIFPRWRLRHRVADAPFVTRWDAGSGAPNAAVARPRSAGRARERRAIGLIMAALMIVSLVESEPIGPGGGSATWRTTAGPGSLAGVPVEPEFRWPLAGHPTVVTPFRPPPRPWLPGHRGVDLAAPAGAAVRAAGAGTVRFAGMIAGVGVVSVDHADGLRTTYQPVAPTVRAGQPVAAGDPIGVLVAGHPGCPVAACLHWGLRRG